MGSNFHTPWTTETVYTPESMNPPLVSLDRALTKLKNLIVHCDGVILYDPGPGTLYWNAPLRFIFNSTDGKACANYVEIGEIQLNDNEFAYVELSDTDGAEITVWKAAISTGDDSNFIAYSIVVLGFKNAMSNNFYPVALRQPWPTTIGS